MVGRFDQRTTECQIAQAMSCGFEQPQSPSYLKEGEASWDMPMDFFQSQDAERSSRLSVSGASGPAYASQAESCIGRCRVRTNDTSPVMAMQSDRQIKMDACGVGHTGEGLVSLVHKSSCLGAPDEESYLSGKHEATSALNPFVAVEVVEASREQGELAGKVVKSESWQTNNEHHVEAGEIAEAAFARIKFWREIFSALTGMHGVYVFANFAFNNPAGGICSLFYFFCSVFAQLDRRPPSYLLTALLSFCFAIVVAVSLGTPVRGFGAFADNPLLRKICVTQVCLLFLATPVAIVVGLRITKLHSLLRQPGVLVPLQRLEVASQSTVQDNAPELLENTNVKVSACRSQTGSQSERRALPGSNGVAQ